MAKTERLERVFKFNELTLADPNQNFTLKQVLDFYANSYPELVNSHLSEPNVVNNKIEYTFETKIGTKG
jgi:PRTRC genetic system protein C